MKQIFNRKIFWVTGVVILLLFACKERQWEFLPTVSTNDIVIFSDDAAVMGGEVTDDGHAAITESGVCFAHTPNPTVNDIKLILSSEVGEFSKKIERLEPQVIYYVRAYAINIAGVSYGNEVSFKTDKPLTDEDGNEYKTVIIGDQVWMAENLRYLPKINKLSEESNKDANYYVYDYDGVSTSEAKITANYKNYGVLYNWPSAMISCPGGWHLPSNSEWETLSAYISNVKGPYNRSGDIFSELEWQDVGNHLKSLNGWENNGNGTDDFFFRGLPGGWRTDTPGKYTAVGNASSWWSSSEYSGNISWTTGMNSYFSSFKQVFVNKDFGASVRCIKD